VGHPPKTTGETGVLARVSPREHSSQKQSPKEFQSPAMRGKVLSPREHCQERKSCVGLDAGFRLLSLLRALRWRRLFRSVREGAIRQRLAKRLSRRFENAPISPEPHALYRTSSAKPANVDPCASGDRGRFFCRDEIVDRHRMRHATPPPRTRPRGCVLFMTDRTSTERAGLYMRSGLNMREVQSRFLRSARNGCGAMRIVPADMHGGEAV
jgi:hypothetical protein